MLPSDALAPAARTAAGLLVLVASLAGLHGAKSPEEVPSAPATTTTTTEAVEVPWAPPAVPVPVEVEAPAPSTTTTAPPATTTTTTAPPPPPTTEAPAPPPPPSRDARCQAAISAVLASGLHPAPGFTIRCAPWDGTARQGWTDIYCADGTDGTTCTGTIYIQPGDHRPDSLWRRVVRHEIGHSWCAHHWVDFSEACARRYE